MEITNAFIYLTFSPGNEASILAIEKHEFVSLLFCHGCLKGGPLCVSLKAPKILSELLEHCPGVFAGLKFILIKEARTYFLCSAYELKVTSPRSNITEYRCIKFTGPALGQDPYSWLALFLWNKINLKTGPSSQ